MKNQPFRSGGSNGANKVVSLLAVEKLSQAQASLLVDKSARWLRDRPDAPRNPDGTYRGGELFGWYRSVVDPEGIGDEAYEVILLVAEELLGFGCNDSNLLARTLVRKIGELREAHGSAALVVLVDEVLSLLSRQGEVEDPVFESREEWEKRIRDDRRREELRYVLICEICGRFRQGRRWGDLPRLPDGFGTVRAICNQDDCEKVAARKK